MRKKRQQQHSNQLNIQEYQMQKHIFFFSSITMRVTIMCKYRDGLQRVRQRLQLYRSNATAIVGAANVYADADVVSPIL